MAIGTLKIYFTSSKYFVIIFFPYITYNILYVFMMCFIIKILITIPIFIFSKIFTTRSRKLMLESRESLITLCCDGSFNQSQKKWASSHAHWTRYSLPMLCCALLIIKSSAFNTLILTFLRQIKISVYIYCPVFEHTLRI